MRETAKHLILKQTNKGLTCIMKDNTNISSGVTNSAALIALVFKDFRISNNAKFQIQWFGSNFSTNIFIICGNVHSCTFFVHCLIP